MFRKITRARTLLEGGTRRFRHTSHSGSHSGGQYSDPKWSQNASHRNRRRYYEEQRFYQEQYTKERSEQRETNQYTFQKFRHYLKGLMKNPFRNFKYRELQWESIHWKTLIGRSQNYKLISRCQTAGKQLNYTLTFFIFDADIINYINWLVCSP